MTVAEEVAAYLGEHCPVVFGIVGAGNLSIFDAIARLGKTEVVCCHHEQAAVMSAGAYYRVSGVVSVALVTTGAGSSNALTGVLSASMDSIPVVIIAGNEASTWPNVGRARGVQGYDSGLVASPMVKRAWTMAEGAPYLHMIQHSFALAKHGRPGPVWLTIPMDIASAAA